MIFDTDVLIWALRGNERAAQAIDQAEERAISIVSHLELIQGARDKCEVAAIRSFILEFETLPLSAEIGIRARIYMESYTLKGALGVADALIAATAAETQRALCSGNVKHYRVIPDLELKPFRP